MPTGSEKNVGMKSAVDMDDAAVQQMVEESVEHAFEDLAARRWIEAAVYCVKKRRWWSSGTATHHRVLQAASLARVLNEPSLQP